MLKALLRRVRAFFTAEILAELAQIKAQTAARDEKIEAALLSIALAPKETDTP